MTYDQFFKKLSKTKGLGWRVKVNAEIRAKGNTCPIVAVDGKQGYTQAGSGPTAKGLGYKRSCQLQWVADVPPSWLTPREKTLRKRMLKAVGLKEISI